MRSGVNITSTGGPAIEMLQNSWLNIESVEPGETTIINRTDPAGSDIELKGSSSINVGEGNQIDNVSCTNRNSLAGELGGLLNLSENCVLPDGSSTGATCMFNGVKLSSGSSVEAFETSEVPFGESCI